VKEKATVSTFYLIPPVESVANSQVEIIAAALSVQCSNLRYRMVLYIFVMLMTLINHNIRTFCAD